MQLHQIIRVLIGVGAILLIPLIAMQVTSEVNWTGSDFLIAGVLLFVTGVLLELATSKPKTLLTKLILSALIILGFLGVWAELAVGIFH